MSTSGPSSGMGSSSSKSESEYNVTNTEQDREVLQSVQNLRILCKQFHTHCRNPLCNRTLPIHDDPDRIDDWRAGARSIPPTTHLSAWTCRCKATTCVGCNFLPTLNARSFFTPLGVVNHCCDLGRLYTIYFLLCRFDDSQRQPEKEAPEKSKAKKKSPTKGTKAASISGVGYASGYDPVAYGGSWGPISVDEIDDIDGFPPDFASYASVVHAHYSTISTGPLPTTDEDEKKEQDALMIETLQLLSPCLPDASYPALMETNLFHLSILFDRITDLIRNDAIADVIERANLYVEVLSFVKLIANIPNLSGLLFEERPEKSRSPGLRALANPIIQDSSIPVISSSSRSASVFASSKNIYDQVKMYLKMAAKKTLTGGSAQTPVNPVKKEIMKLCEGILELHENLKTKADVAEQARVKMFGNVNAGFSIGAETAWGKYQEENRVTFTDEVLVAHRFTSDINAFKSSGAKNRLNTISKEVATLTTSLPPGIFLKVAESRSDVMKVLIVGSGGSPYAGGLFTFDIFLPPDYPIVPPKMAFVLDGNDTDTYSFNPNLHVGGSVCLSILNTWSGMPQEMWQPNKSTILAVLVSVQAMILGAPYPWHNEPGHENEGESPQVKENKMVVQTKTLRYAMIAWVENTFQDPKAKEHVWADISKTYWKYNGKNVLAEVDTWVPDNPRLLNFSPNLPYPLGPKKGRGKSVPNTQIQGVNLLNKLAVVLGLDPPYPDVEPEDKKKKGLLSKLMKGKRKVSESDLNLAHHLKKQKSESNHSGSFEQKWIYTGTHNQKESRAACKEFGIGSASSIKETIKKLEKHVNEKGKANPALMEKWGKSIYVEEPDLEASSAGSSFPGEESTGLSDSEY
ncbi:uncharacterized protein LY89DRAFT_735511 [Mollisia scopiformis]|uniref:UBC core domain-containing protein n=1 Tax=Mollisia scopiformis TaxID=149040 RepID=A0A194X6G2_MOLSC|nr:uncharacterized protein LY89DRAFT_735511 [Mollisia scopiformis]KUJ15397.1 hypothetical protein LY89DRAFT_735511 [Mollisia scopiformis]